MNLTIRRLVWLSLLAALAGYEASAVFNRVEGDTLSETIWDTLAYVRDLPGGGLWVALLSIAGLGLVGWAGLHFAQHLIRKGKL